MRWAAALLTAVSVCAAAEPVVVDFENVTVLLANDKANRVPQYVEKGVTFTLAHEPKQTKGKGMLGFFTHLSTGHKGLVSAMATEPIPVRATFPASVSSVTVTFWGSTGVPAVLEAFDSEGKVVDRAKLDSAPARKASGDPAPTFSLTVKSPRIAYIEFSGPREGEFLAADEVRFTPAD
jgi:hypothetical protein